MRIPTSDETCGSGPAILYEFLPASSVPRLLAVPADREVRAHLGRVRRLALGQLLEGDGVAGDGERLARRELALDDRVVGARAGDPDREQHDRDVDDVAAVAAAVAADERRERDRATTRSRAPAAPACRARTRARSRRARRPRRCRRSGRGSTSRRRARAARRRSRRRRRTGQRNVRPRPRSDARRHAISGPTPISSSSGRPKIRRKKS